MLGKTYVPALMFCSVSSSRGIRMGVFHIKFFRRRLARVFVARTVMKGMRVRVGRTALVRGTFRRVALIVSRATRSIRRHVRTF